jgi:hypothetical protein
LVQIKKISIDETKMKLRMNVIITKIEIEAINFLFMKNQCSGEICWEIEQVA